ncbi:MAG: hypothetical protein KDD37_01500 [Bdellovibrionales bacterium]|nr:hypothetical protein [Bdellovibrionales bacterium]
MILSVFAALMLQQVFSATEVQLEGGLRAESNAFYRDRDLVTDFALYVKPSISLSKETKSTASNLHVHSDYSKYTGNSSLDYFDYDVSANTTLNTRGKWVWSGAVSYALNSEPPDDQGIERLDKTETTESLKLTYKKSKIRQHSVTGYSRQTNFSLDTLEYGNNVTVGGSYEYQYYFLPETAFLFIVDAESSTYANGLKFLNQDPGTTRYLYDNTLYRSKFGIKGRLTEFTELYLFFGYAMRTYEKDTSFNEPVFEVRFQEQITPQDILIAGYIYKTLDSFYTNYEINQHMFIGYSRVFGDRFIVSFRSDYIYTSFSLPNRREDQRLTGTLRADISYKPNWIIQAGIVGDFLASDTLNQTSSDVLDPATSYQALQVFVGSKFAF